MFLKGAAKYFFRVNSPVVRNLLCLSFTAELEDAPWTPCQNPLSAGCSLRRAELPTVLSRDGSFFALSGSFTFRRSIP